MLSISRAVKAIGEKWPKRRIAAAFSSEKMYVFRLLDRDNFPKTPIDVPLTVDLTAFDKETGKVFSTTIYDIPDDCNPINISSYLDGEDQQAYRDFRNMFGGR